MNINPDRARSRLQNMANTQLWKYADKHHVGQAEHGRKLTRKRLIARLMLVGEVVQELGAAEA